MATIPACQVPVRPTVAGKRRGSCEWPSPEDYSGYCEKCEEGVAALNAVDGWTHPTHRAPTHAKPYSEDAEHAAAWRSELLPARTSRRAAAA